jgi:hypothetical protein
VSTSGGGCALMRGVNGHLEVPTGGQQIAAAACVHLGLAHSLPERLGAEAEIAGDVGDRSARLEHRPYAALAQLIGVLPRSCHGPEDSLSSRTTSWDRSLRQTRPASVAGFGGLPSWPSQAGPTLTRWGISAIAVRSSSDADRPVQPVPAGPAL